MNKKNVKLLRDAVAGMKPEACNMSKYTINIYGYGDMDKPVMGVLNAVKQAVPTDCGTTFCIAGLASVMTASNKELKMKWGKFQSKIQKENGPKYSANTESRDPARQQDKGFFFRARKFLGLSAKTASRLFIPNDKGKWGSVPSIDDFYAENDYDSLLYIDGEEGKQLILNQLDYMLKTGKV